MTPISADAESTVSELLRELAALRSRLDQAPAWFRCPLDTMKAGALAEEVNQLCQEAGRSAEEVEVARLLAQARQNLDQLQTLLGLH